MMKLLGDTFLILLNTAFVYWAYKGGKLLYPILNNTLSKIFVVFLGYVGAVIFGMLLVYVSIGAMFTDNYFAFCIAAIVAFLVGGVNDKK